VAVPTLTPTLGARATEYLTLIEAWDGRKWAVVRAPNVPGLLVDSLDGIFCVSVSFCQAVGYYQDSSEKVWTLALTWDGTSWSVVPTPNPGSSLHSSELSSVSCTSRSNCQAVGTDASSTKSRLTLAESWNGRRWSIVHSPNRANAYSSALSAVSCLSVWECTATSDQSVYSSASGTYDTDTLVETWVDARWTLVPSPNPVGSGYNELEGVACGAE
jgi:hypothetical protein